MALGAAGCAFESERTIGASDSVRWRRCHAPTSYPGEDQVAGGYAEGALCAVSACGLSTPVSTESPIAAPGPRTRSLAWPSLV